MVLGGFRTVIKDGDRPLIFMTAHQFIKTFYIAFLFRPLSFFRCSTVSPNSALRRCHILHERPAVPLARLTAGLDAFPGAQSRAVMAV